MASVQPISRAQFDAWTGGTRPDVELVGPGVWSIPVAFPENPLRYTLAYAIRVRAGIVLIDPGYGSDENWELLCSGLRRIGAQISEVRAVVVTHYHLDHWGNADRIAEAAGCEVVIGASEVDWYTGRHLQEFSPAEMSAWYTRLGAPAEALQRIMSTDDVHQPLMHDAPLHRLSPGEAVPFTEGILRAVGTPGHTDGHLSFLHEQHGMLFGGDHVLPTVSTNVSLTPFGSPDPLNEFLTSFDRLMKLNVDSVLPAHQYRYTGLHARITSMRATTERRLAFVRDALRQHTTVSPWEIATLIPRKRRPWEEFDALSTRLGLGEAAAYLAHLGAFVR
ncbi:MAG: MBL fold metallo-hydrolase [Leucobacter sp.]